jgi:hypothetical protein
VWSPTGDRFGALALHGHQQARFGDLCVVRDTEPRLANGQPW